MHFIILIPIILLFKLILWLLGITIVVSGLKAFGEFVFKYKYIFITLVILSCGYFVYVIYSNVPNASENQQYSYIEPSSPPKPNYIQELAKHKKYHKSGLNTESLKLHHKRGEEVQFTITLRNRNKKLIESFHGYILVWDKNNKYIGDYDFDDTDAINGMYDNVGMRWDDKKEGYYALPNKSLTFDFAYTDESITKYNFKNFKYIVCFSQIVFEDKTKYFDK
jgi:hypothetical protein